MKRKFHAPFWSSGRRSDPPIDCNGTRPYAHDGLKSPGAYAMQLSRGARDLIAFLATTGYIPPPVPLAPTSAAPALLVTFNGWMRTHRGTTDAHPAPTRIRH